MNQSIDRLLELNKLLEQGRISEEEYQQLKNEFFAGRQAPDPGAQAYPGRNETVLEGLEVGKRIGPDDQPFELIERIGSGGQGEVWLARDLNASQRQGREVLRALKLLPPELYSRPDYQKLLEREADLACELAHPHIINVLGLRPYQLGRHRQPMLIMEYLQGEDLRSKLLAADGRPLDWDLLMTWFSQAADGLKYAWEKHRIIHRDLKPENLFITQAGDLKLLDFGLAWRIRNSLSKLSRDQAQSQGTGTIEYLPPEAFLGGTQPGPKHDVYALACVLYEALTGDPPFGPELSRSRQPEQMPPRPEGLNNARWQVLKQGLAFHAEERPDNAWEWLHALKETTRSPHEAQRNAGKKETPNSSDSAKGAIRATHPVKASSGNDEQNKLIRYLNSVGKKAFVDWYETFHSYAKGSLSKQACIDVLVKEGVSNASGAAMRCSNAQRIFAMNKQRDALKIVSESRRLPADTIVQARKLLEERGPSRSSHAAQRNAGKEEATRATKIAKPPVQNIQGWSDGGDWSRVQALQERTAKALGLPVVFRDHLKDGSEGPEMVIIPAGTYLMGSPEDEPERWDVEGPQHEVTIGQPFALGKTEVTFDEWDACVADGCCSHKPNDEGWGRRNRPVIDVSWDDIQEYINWLNKKTGKHYRLPSEAEWEYAARGGTSTPFYTGDCITTDQANYDGNVDYNDCGAKMGKCLEQTMPVGSYSTNPFGLHDMHGNVWEWVQDYSNHNYKGAPTDGNAWERGNCEWRILRGGSWLSFPRFLRSAGRLRSSIGGRYDNGGFRLVRTVMP